MSSPSPDFTSSYFGTSAGDMWASPFADYASLAMPRTMPDILKYCELLLMSNGVYRMALQRVLSYFITDVDIGGDDVSDEERDRWTDFLKHTLGLPLALNNSGMDLMAYGNGFSSLVMPFRRHVSCPKCSLEVPLSEAYDRFSFQWSIPEMRATCPSCAYTGVWHGPDRPPHDRRTGEFDGIKLKRWNPHQIDILWDFNTEDTAYIWKIPATDRRMVQEGKLFHLERTPWEVIMSVAGNQNLRFDKDYIYHMKEDTLAGIFSRGWGIPRTLTNFRHAYYVQILHRYNEVIAMDYVIPFRVITPAPRAGAGLSEIADPLLSINLGDFSHSVRQMIRARRQDPAQWHTLPFPVQYQMLGGEARELAPHELLDQGLDMLLNAVGTPVELYKGTLSLQAAPVALRLFESTWNPLVQNLNSFVRWIVRRVAQLLAWQPVSAKLARVTHVDDINRQMAVLQLMLNKVISPTSGLKAIGLDYRDETRRMNADQRLQAEEAERLQAELEGSGIGPAMSQDPAAMGQSTGQPAGGAVQAPAAGGAAAPPGAQDVLADVVSQVGPNTPVSLQDIEQAAQAIGDRLLALSDSERTSQLIRLKRMNQLLHSAVTSYLNSVRQKARSTGQQMVLSQQYGGS